MSAWDSGVRITWTDLPAHVRAAVDEVLGSPVVEAVSQPGGFSPGTADRVRTADGTRAFVKATGTPLNTGSVSLHRRELGVTQALPPIPSLPRLIGSHDDGDWVALVLEDIEGRHPATPWVADELDHVLTSLARLAEEVTPAPVSWLPTLGDLLRDDFQGWALLRADPSPDLDPWAAEHLDELVALAERGLSALSGDTLVHTDVRADNLLVRADGTVVVVDWPHAAVGPAWLDTLWVLVNVELYGGHDTDALADRWIDADPDDVTGALVGLTGFFVDGARRPPLPGLPTLREFQRRQGVSTLGWVRRRLSNQ